jgi:hypothetical protein
LEQRTRVHDLPPSLSFFASPSPLLFVPIPATLSSSHPGFSTALFHEKYNKKRIFTLRIINPPVFQFFTSKDIVKSYSLPHLETCQFSGEGKVVD